MSNQVSERIDIYTKGNLRELKQEEAKTGRKFTKYDIAQKMLSEGKLSESDFAQWMNTPEGYESSVLTSQQKQALMQGSVWTLNQNNESYLDEFDTYIKDPLTGVKLKDIAKQDKKTNISSELAKDIEIRENVVDLVLNNAQTALSMIESYHDSIGYISADAFVQGMNVLGNVSWDLLTGRQDFVTVFEQEKGLAQEIETLKKLKNKTKSPMEFAKEFKKLYGVEFKPENFKRLSEVSRQLNELNAYAGLDKYFAFGIEKLKDADMNSLDPAAYLAPVFGNNPIKAQEYINELKSECKNDEELREKLTSILVESKKETESKLALLEHSRSRLESEFKSAYKSAMGDYKSDEIIEGYINIQRMNAMGTEVAGTIALSMFTMGSSAVMKMSSKVISKMGVKAGSQIVKAGMTGTMAAVPAAETVVGGLTSKSGMTLEKGGQAWEELKNGLMYGAFGAYISGPLGNVVSKVLSKNPQIFSQLVASQKFSLGAGAVAETSADVLFDRITSDLSFKESLAQNGIMNFGMMFVGARMHKGLQLPDADLSQIKIEKMRDGSFNLKANGKVFFKAKNADELAVATLILGGKSKVENVTEPTVSNTGRQETPEKSNLTTRLNQAVSREDFAAIRDEIKSMPDSEEKKFLQEQYVKKYREFSAQNNKKFDIKMELKQDSENTEVLDHLKALGATDEQIDNFKKNTSDEVISYIESRISAPDFNPSTENYFIHLNQNNISFIKELAADPNFPKEQLSLVANAAYSQNFVIQISNAYKKGINIIPGCMKIAQMKAAQEARMKDPAVIASQKAYEDAIQRIKENCSLTDAEIREISRDINIRETAIQDLIIYCKKNGIKNYHSILYNCSINREGINLSSKEIEERVKFAKRGLENKVDPGEMSSMVYQYGKYSPSEMEAQLNKVIEETRIANEKRLAKETAIANKKDSLRKKYNTTEAKDIVERIINKENLPEDLLTHLDEILGENPNSAKCRFLEKCVSEIKPEKFNLGLFKTNFEAGLKKADISSISLNAKWQPRPEAKNVILTPEYLSALKDKDGKPIFNNLAVENIIEKSKTNPDLVKEIVDMAIENRSLRAPAVLKPLLEAAFIDRNLAFSVLSMKKNNGEPRFNTLELSIVLDSFKSKLPLVKEIFNLEKLYNMDINPSRVILQTNSTEDIRTAFSYQYCRMLNDIKKDNGSPMYHPFYDIREGIQQALIDNPEVTLHYLNKNVPNDRTAYNGTVIRALNNIAKKCPELEIVFRQRLEFIKNDESHTQRDKMLGTIKALAEVNNFDNALKIYEHASELGIDNHINTILEKADSIPYDKLVYLKDTLGRERISQMSAGELSFAIEFAHLAKVSNINEIPMENKKTFLRDLVASNSDLFKISDELAKDFPILPRNQEQYCELLPSLVRSLGIETVQLSPEKVETFKKSIDDLSQSIAKISDSEFANLHISQEFTKDDFVNVVLEKVKDLPQTERQKVFDYFGFDIIKNDGNKTSGYSITGYPVNLNNGKKLAQITDPKTQAVVENLKPDVIKFSQNNPIKCENPAVEKLLNEIAEVLPEIRTMIGKTQHATHSFDVMQHSLKVMQKISQDPKFKTLNESDQKIMLLASLLHDITKREGFSDKTHASNGGFDAFYIAKKFNLTREEEIKLYSIARHHEWLEFVNTSRNEAELTKRLQSVAFDLQQDNLFDMALMFTHADLKAVKSDNTFHDSTTGRINPKFNGEERVFNDNKGAQISLGQSADIYAKRIKTYINELKKSIPLTPVTQVPTSDVIRTHIKQINPDGSTEHKGVYVDSDGLIVIKFNEVTDWEALGFPKGTTTSGVTGTGRVRREKILESEFNTGNFKFFAHALNYSNQLVKFDSFGLPDSDALLSVTYMERPESKHRNYRTQGIGLNIKSKYVYGGGETDAGSGYSKNIAEFKENYIFGGRREGDRVFTANLIKKATGMSDEQYIEFVEKNQNKSWNEVEPIDNSDPVEFRNKLIKAFAENIVSSQRAQKRAYDEFYASNPEAPMFTWAYSADANEKIKNPLEFLHRNELTQVEKNIKQIGEVELTPVAERTEFLRQYSLERDIPMFIFGD